VKLRIVQRTRPLWRRVGEEAQFDLRHDVSSAANRGVSFLASRQLASGQFPVEATIHSQRITTPDQSLFATTHILYSLDFVPGDLASGMIARGLDYFKAEMTGRGLWRYWNRDADWGGRKINAFIPADLDDTANVSYLLRRHGVPFPDNRPLILLNSNRAGLYYTWLMLRPARTLSPRYWLTMLGDLTVQRVMMFWKASEAGYLDIDGVVNANALLYLGECPETAAVIDWLIEIVRMDREATCDKWYRDAFSLYYALSRNYRAGVRTLGVIVPEILARLRGAAAGTGQIGENALQTALAVNTMLNLGVEADAVLIVRALDYLLATQSAAGSWPSAPYYYGGPKKAVSWGSSELTTGLCLEALARLARTAQQTGGVPQCAA
jgi:hypothetical protein